MLRIGVFGVGHLGKYHLDNWKEIGDIALVGFYDPHDETALAAQEKYGIPRFEDPEALMDASDAIDIAAPTLRHYEISILAIRKHKHVFVEKPLAYTLEEGREIVQLVKEAGVKLQVGHMERFNPAFLVAQSYVNNPMFIEVHRLAQFSPRGTEMSVITDLMINDLDIILNLVKSPVKNLYASGVAVMGETPDIASVRIEFNNGCVANLTSSRISMKKMRKIRLFQKDAYIGIDFLARKTEIIKIRQPSDEHVYSFDLETPKGTRTIAIANPEVRDTNAIKLELEAFRDAIQKNTRTPVNEVDGFLAMEVAQRIIDKISNTTLGEA